MSIRTPPTLLRLAGRSLLRDQAAAITALEYLPAEFFKLLSIQACRRRMRKPLKVLVQAWPFPVLPLGSLMRLPPVMVLKVVLEGLDGLLAQEVRPRRWKLRVLDLRNKDVNLWRMCPNMEHPLAPLEVFLDLDFSERDGVKFFMYIIQWAQQRKGLVHLCCKTLRFFELPFQRARKVLDRVQLDCIQEVQVDCTWEMPTLGTFALYLGQLSNLQSLALCHIKVLRLQHLKKLYLDSPSFLRGRLDQMLRQLKSLHLYGANLTDFSPEPLRALLEAVTPTLQDLRLDNCAMVDCQVEAILPVLSRCHQLRDFTITENPLSVATVEKLLRHTAGLRSLEHEPYPIPLECYRTHETVDQERVALIQAELTGTLRELGQTRTIHLDTKYFSSGDFYDVAFS
ncbi:PRAME family member 12-like [Myotis daubentonii]|uniref:PRAME family member 12-like n=1 Tax=Myotis daubentonii TaxID=98922 RepID=UPI002872BB49|nr:PRAME family member 12-like [Myotis daubentonii]